MKFAWALLVLFTVQIFAQPVPGGTGDYEHTGGIVRTDGDILIACIQDSGQLWVYKPDGSNGILDSLPAVAFDRANDNGGCGLLLTTSDIQGVADIPAGFDVMSQGNPRDSWAVSGVPVGASAPILGASDLYFTLFADSSTENFDIERNLAVTLTGSGTFADPLRSVNVLTDASYSTDPQLTIQYDCYSLPGITQTIICDVSITNNLAVNIDDVRFRKSTDYDPRGGVINTITVLNNLPLGVSIGLIDSPYSYEEAVPGVGLSEDNCPNPIGCGPDQLGVSFEIPIGTLEPGHVYRFQMYYGGANDRDALVSDSIGLFAVDANIAFYGETFSRAFVADLDLTNCVNADTAAACFDADSWLLGVGYPYTDCGCWSLWECPEESDPVSPVLCSGPTEYFEDPVAVTGVSPNAYLIHSTTSSQAYRFLAAGCTLVANVGDCAPTTFTTRDDYEKRWYCRTPDRQCVLYNDVPASEITYVIAIGPAAGIECTRCLGEDCSITEATPPVTSRDCFAYWTCDSDTAVPQFPTCVEGPVSAIGPDADEDGSYGWIIHSDTPGQSYSFPAGCTKQYLFGSACDATTAGPLREDWQLRYPCGSTDGVCTTADFNPATGVVYEVDIGPAPTIDCDTCLDADSCTVPKGDVTSAQCDDYVLP